MVYSTQVEHQCPLMKGCNHGPAPIHRVGEYYIGNTRIIEQGAFSDVSKNNYNNGRLYNSQKEGFVYLCQDIMGKTIREKTELVALN